MYTKWTTHCKNEHEKATFEADLRRARSVLDRLKDILEQELEVAEKQEIGIEGFSSPSWPYLQAYILGCKANAKDLIKLIDLDKQKDTIHE